MNVGNLNGDKDRAIVAGGGIGGLGAAVALASSGVPVAVLERHPEFAEVGAGLQVGPNAVRALDRLGVLDRIYETAVFPEQAVILDAISGEELTRMDLQAPMIARFGYPYLVLHRNDVLTALLEAAKDHPLIELSSGSEVERIVQEGDYARVVCKGGLDRTTPLVVGADGIRSRVRRNLRDDPIVFSGCIAYRGAMPIEDFGSEGRPNEVRLWIGPDIHLMQYPVRRGEMYNQVAVFRSRRWAEGRHDWGGPDELVERFAGACSRVQAAIPIVADAPAYPNQDKEPLETFVHGRSVLIGDAAHPMLQYLGQGACTALEDGLVLASALGGGLDDVTTALARYDALRVPRTTKCQRVARPWGESWHTDHPVTVAYRNRYLRSRRSDDYADVAWLYEDVLDETTEEIDEAAQLQGR